MGCVLGLLITCRRCWISVPQTWTLNSMLLMVNACQTAEPFADYNGVPRVLHTLTNALQRLGGYSTEGIFRISPSMSELMKLRDEVRVCVLRPRLMSDDNARVDGLLSFASSLSCSVFYVRSLYFAMIMLSTSSRMGTMTWYPSIRTCPPAC